MLDSYEEGQRLHTDDFIDDYYMPQGKYEYAEIMSIDDDIVTICYHGKGGDDIMEWTRAEMEHMLGWDLTKDDDRFEGDSGSGGSTNSNNDDTDFGFTSEDDDENDDADDDSKPSEDELEFF